MLERDRVKGTLLYCWGGGLQVGAATRELSAEASQKTINYITTI